MLRFLTEEDIESLDDPYFRGRFGYMSRATGFVRSLPGVEHWPPESVLELGPYRAPLICGCHTMDYRTYEQQAPTILHDATETPWPVPEAEYELFVALQVFEHLEGCQRAAFDEVRRIARWAVLSIPYKWTKSRFAGHVGLDEETLRDWTRLEPVRSHIEHNGNNPDGRLVALYDLKAEPCRN